MTYSKLKDKIVLYFDVDSGVYKIQEPALLPFQLRDGMIDLDGNGTIVQTIKNYNALMRFFGSRALSVKRENAKKVLNALKISQRDDNDTKYKIILLCKALSTDDDYWITSNLGEKWDSVNLYENHLSEAISQIALAGKSLTVTGKIHTPELTGQGAYAKAWFREEGWLWLYKAPSKGGDETNTEVSVSNILDKTNVPHVRYVFAEKFGMHYSKCRSMKKKDCSIVTAEDVASWCNRVGISFENFVKKLDSENFYKTIIVDYLISNSDRHGQNWGFFMDNTSGRLLGLHPLFDHNNAFDPGDMESPYGGDSLMMLGKTKKEAALYAIKHCGFKVIEHVDKSDFSNTDAYLSFSHRLKLLGVDNPKQEKTFSIRKLDIFK